VKGVIIRKGKKQKIRQRCLSLDKRESQKILLEESRTGKISRSSLNLEKEEEK
jgi:hypothetical protein